MSEYNAPSQTQSLLTLTASVRSAKTRKRLLTYTKLINMYRAYECLWMETHVDFFNFALKDEIWDAIAEKMMAVTPSQLEPNPDKWKRLIHKLRYKVELQQVNEEKAKFLKQLSDLPKKPFYSDKLQFLSKHRFDRNDRTHPVPTLQPEKKPSESLASRFMRLGRAKTKHRVSFTNKLKTFETLRNCHRCTLVLTPESFSNLQLTEKKLFKKHA